MGIALTAPFAISVVFACVHALYLMATLPEPKKIVIGPLGTVEFSVETTIAEAQRVLKEKFDGSWFTDVVFFSNQMFQKNDAQKAGIWAAVSIFLGSIVWVLTWCIGWISAGFSRDEPPLTTHH